LPASGRNRSFAFYCAGLRQDAGGSGLEARAPLRLLARLYFRGEDLLEFSAVEGVVISLQALILILIILLKTPPAPACAGNGYEA